MIQINNFIKERITMCYEILTQPNVLVVTSKKNDTLKRIEFSSINMKTCDVVTISNTLIDAALQEQKHYTAVDNLIKNL